MSVKRKAFVSTIEDKLPIKIDGGSCAVHSDYATSSQVNNCCSIDRQCTTDEEWTAGYYAFQNNQCAAPAQQTVVVSSKGSDSKQLLFRRSVNAHRIADNA